MSLSDDELFAAVLLRCGRYIHRQRPGVGYFARWVEYRNEVDAVLMELTKGEDRNVSYPDFNQWLRRQEQSDE